MSHHHHHQYQQRQEEEVVGHDDEDEDDDDDQRLKHLQRLLPNSHSREGSIAAAPDGSSDGHPVVVHGSGVSSGCDDDDYQNNVYHNHHDNHDDISKCRPDGGRSAATPSSSSSRHYHQQQQRQGGGDVNTTNSGYAAAVGSSGAAAAVNDNLMARARRVGVKIRSITAINTICDTAFRWVDSERCRYIDLQQNRTALSFVFQQLRGEVPVPNEYWYELVFRNFDRDQDGLIHYNDFFEIVLQYYEHHAERRLQQQQQQQQQEGCNNKNNHQQLLDHSQQLVILHNASNEKEEEEEEVMTMTSKKAIIIMLTQHVGMNSVVDNQPPFVLEEQKRENTPSVLPSSPPDLAIITCASSNNNNNKKEEVGKMNGKDDDNKSNRGISSSASLPLSFTPHNTSKGVLEASSCYPPVPRGGPHAPQPSTPIHNTPSTGIGSASTGSRRVNLRDSVMYPSYKSRLAIFDDYEFFDKAGEGAFGKVLVVRHKTTKHVRACKAMGLHSPQQRDLIQTEIDLLKSLDHPNILKLFETYVD
ncbi:hypothetical protein FOZ63_000729, partial [Perkinsus olseni]